MKKIRFLIKTLLVAVVTLCSNVVMAQEFSITYDFKTYCESLGLSKNIAADAFSHPTKKGRISGLATSSVDFYYIEDYSYSGKEFYFDNNFAIQNDDIKFRNGGTSALQAIKGNRHIALVNLKAGDKITITRGDSDIKFGNANVTDESVVAGTTVVESGKEYEIKEDGDLAFSFSQWAYLYTVTIKSSVEFLTNPKCIKETAQDGTSKVLTVSHGRTNDPDANLVTYYTTNENEDPATSENKTEYTGPITVSTPSKYYFKTINTHTNKVSELTVVDVSEAGATPKLNAPTASITRMENNENGFYSPVYTFEVDLTGVPGVPLIDYTYSFENGEETKADNYKATKSGKLKITVSSDGYESASAEMDILGGDYFKAKPYNFTSVSLTDLTSTEQETTAGDQDVDKTGCHHYAISSSKSTLFNGITLNNFYLAIGITAGKTVGVYTRTGKGSVDMTMHENQIALFNAHHRTGTNAGYDETIILPYSTGNESFDVPQYTLLKSADIYELVPENIPVTISSDYGYSTFSSDVDVDFSANDGITVYTANMNDDNTVVKLTEVADKKVPAGAGVLLKGEGTFTGVATTGVAAFTDNAFVASEGGTTVTREDGIYVLNNKSGIGFYPFVGTLSKGKAHLVIANSEAKSIKMSFGDETTGISEIETTGEASGVYHTLSGIRVQNPAKGLYILNGKKVIIK